MVLHKGRPGHSGSQGTVNLSLFLEIDTNKSHYINITGHAWGSQNKIAAQLETIHQGKNNKVGCVLGYQK